MTTAPKTTRRISIQVNGKMVASEMFDHSLSGADLETAIWERCRVVADLKNRSPLRLIHTADYSIVNLVTQ